MSFSSKVFSLKGDINIPLVLFCSLISYSSNKLFMSSEHILIFELSEENKILIIFENNS